MLTLYFMGSRSAGNVSWKQFPLTHTPPYVPNANEEVYLHLVAHKYHTALNIQVIYYTRDITILGIGNGFMCFNVSYK